MFAEQDGVLSAIVVVCAITVAGCESGRPGQSYVIPGPTGPTPVSTVTPYVWDTREELAVWADNRVSRGPISMSGDGPAAVIRIESGAPTFSLENGSRVQWVLRGPDFETPVTGIRSVKIRYTWLPAIRNSTVPVAIPDINAAFEGPEHRLSSDQLTLRSDIAREPSGEMLLDDEYTVPFEARYFYLYSDGGNRGVLEIDSISLVRD